MRIATALCTLILASTFSLVACGGGGDDDGGADDTGDNMGDDDQEPMPDANTPPEAKQIGDTCTPDAANPQGPGDCGEGLVCLNLQGASNPWCSKTCADDTACRTGYTGPGDAQCIFGITFTEGGEAVPYCGVVCNDVEGDPAVCGQGASCNGTCPGSLQCAAPLNDQASNAHVADACI